MLPTPGSPKGSDLGREHGDSCMRANAWMTTGLMLASVSAVSMVGLLAGCQSSQSGGNTTTSGSSASATAGSSTVSGSPKDAALVKSPETFLNSKTPTATAPTGGGLVDGGAGPKRATGEFPKVAQGEPFCVINGERVPVPNIPMGDAATIQKILTEGQYNNQTFATLSYICNTFGPRLTGSTAQENTAKWALALFRSWGLKAELVEWGPIPVRFDRGPSTGMAFKAGGEPRKLEFSTLAWTPGTKGPAKGKVFKQPTTEDEYAAMKDSLQGAWILLPPPNATGQRGVRTSSRDRFDQRAKAREDLAKGASPDSLPLEVRVGFKGIAGFISQSRDERVWTGATSGWMTLDPKKPETWPQDVEVTVRQSDYDYFVKAIEAKESIEAEFNLDNKMIPGPFPVYCVVAELTGTELPDEVVIVSGHMDSWDGPGSRGTTDNGTGTSVTIETARILTAVGAKPKRSIRFALWSGEEQGLHGSRAYVQKIKDEWSKVSACFVDDGGTNYQGGIPCADNMVEYLAAATAPVSMAFPEMPVNIRPTGPTIQTHGSSDHASFNAVGVPGFFWDEVGKADYGYGWHTQYDRLDLAIPEYLTQSSTCSAVTAYNLACAPSMLPRAQRNPEGARPQRRVNPNRVNDSLAGRPDGTESGGPDRPARPARPTNAPAAPATAEPSK